MTRADTVPPFEAHPAGPAGAVQYAVDRVGTFTLSWDTTAYRVMTDPPHPGDRYRNGPIPTGGDGTRIHVHYGAWDGHGWVREDRPLSNAPVLFGVHLGGAAVFDAEKALAWRDHPDEWATWLVCRREQTAPFTGGGSAPAATRRRAAVIVTALVHDFLDRPDRDARFAAHRAHHAPSRLAEHQREINRLRGEIGTREARLRVVEAYADTQVALIPPGPDTLVSAAV